MNELLGISHYCGDLNLTGATLIRYIPLLWVNRVAYEDYIFSNGTAKAVPLKTGKKWLTMPVLPTAKDVQIWEESEEPSAQGTQWAERVQGVIPAHSPELAKELQKMWGLRFLVEVSDSNEHKFVLGTLQQPLTFTANYNSARSGHSFTFTGRVGRKAPGSLN
jgi:hypothetical protein